ncbi:hypothetical protein F511_21407 [Dorcoceras hygrometricum]|uniref:Uncharacterized protein n=1 Tax=Dorcoceras hygrometricum TaxID=472368 RepID=A0A2Z7DB62_9LAMI|nr:hypothetical protein F511_21407 [Dorcoceras hygrometricum]
MKRRRAEESAYGLALMTSSVMSSYSADGLREQSQESAGSLYIQMQERSDVVKVISSRKLLFTSRCYLEIAIAKRCRLHNSRKLQWIQSQRKDFQKQCLFTQTQEYKSIVVEEDSGEAIDEPDASNSSIQSIIDCGPNSTLVIQVYAGLNYKNKAQNNKDAHPEVHASRRKTRHMFLPKTSNARNPTLPNSALIHGLKWVAIERAKLGEFNATKIIKNRGWQRRESAVESYGEQ